MTFMVSDARWISGVSSCCGCFLTREHTVGSRQPEKSLSARAVFKEFPSIKRRLWGGELWEDGYFVRTVGDKVTVEVIRQYIRRHKEEPDQQLKLF